MAEERKEICYRETGGLTVPIEDNKNFDIKNNGDSKVVKAVIENNAIVENTDKSSVKEFNVISSRQNETVVNVKTEVIILDEAPVGKSSLTTSVKFCDNNPRIIELSDKISKMELRRQFKVDDDVKCLERSAGGSDNFHENIDDDSVNIMSRLPPGTVLIKQNMNRTTTGGTKMTGSCSQGDSDYVHESSKDSTETNSSESSSAASYSATSKVKRMQHRTVRSQKIVEVRRNPIRNKKKKQPIDEDFVRPRQRLLSVKRKSGFVVDPVMRKRAKPSTTPYMHTRSVTRKMYNVGATYQAPTIQDTIEWKEWPVHGMHERPIWHPHVGLAYEYINRRFVSLDGQSYQEIIDEPVIEVVSVDPHPERMPLVMSEKRKLECTNPINSKSFDSMSNKNDSDALHDERSFATCMHSSLHSVLAYCSRVVTPTYKKNVETNLRNLTKMNDNSECVKSITMPKLKSATGKMFSNDNKIGIPPLLPVNSILATSSSTSMIHDGTYLPNVANVPNHIIVPKRTINFNNARSIQGNHHILQNVFQRPSKTALTCLKPSEIMGKPDVMYAASKPSTVEPISTYTKDFSDLATVEMNLAKLDDDCISDETLMEMSSIYNTLLPNDDAESSSAKHSESVDDSRSSVKTSVLKKSPSAETKENQSFKTSLPSYPGLRCENHTESINTDLHNPSRSSTVNQAAEIAKILSDYNQKAEKNMETRNMSCPSSNTLNVRTMDANVVKLGKNYRNDQRNTITSFSLTKQSSNVKSSKYENIADSNIEIRTTYKTENTCVNVIDDSRAMDLTTTKSSNRESKTFSENAPDESTNQQWLQELIEDTAMLYCAAAGIHQNDVADYLNTLDSKQSLEWLGS